MLSEYQCYSKRVKQCIADRENFQQIHFDMNADHSACLLIIDSKGHIHSDKLPAILTDSFKYNPEGLADKIVKMIHSHR